MDLSYPSVPDLRGDTSGSLHVRERIVDIQNHRIAQLYEEIAAKQRQHEATRIQLNGRYSTELREALESILPLSSAVAVAQRDQLWKSESFNGISDLISKARVLFERARDTAKAILEEAGLTESDDIQQETNLAAMIAHLKQYQDTMKSETDRAVHACKSVNERLVEAVVRMRSVEDDLNGKKNQRRNMSIFEELFANTSELDYNIRTLQEAYDRMYSNVNDMNREMKEWEVVARRLASFVEELYRKAEKLQEELDILQANDNELIARLHDADALFCRTYDMVVAMQSYRTKYNRDECLRHILQLVGQDLKNEDTAGMLGEYKNRVEGRMIELLGPAQVEELHKPCNHQDLSDDDE